MDEQRTVLVTGVAGRWGRRLARQLVKFPFVRVIGLDILPPQRPIDGVEYIEADLRNPLLVELLRQEQVEGILHMVFASGVGPDGTRLSTEQAFQTNVLGTIELLAAAHAASVKQVVIKSTTLVYGAQIDNPLYITESAALRGRDGKPLLRQRYEIENAVADFRRTHDLQIAVLRFPGIVGASGASSLMRYLALPTPPTLLGFDPLYQIVHEADVVGSLLHALATEANGVFNVAAEDVVTLTQMIRQVGHQPLPIFHPLAYQLRRLPGFKNNVPLLKDVPFELDYLRYSWMGDLTRMHTELGYTPQHTAHKALEAYRTSLRLHRFADVTRPTRRTSDNLREFLQRSRRRTEQEHRHE